MKKKVMVLFMALIMAASFTACSGNSSQSGTTAAATQTEAKSSSSDLSKSNEDVKDKNTDTNVSSGQSSDSTDSDKSESTDEIFTKRDLTQTADLTDAKTYTLSDNQNISITSEGVYVIKGSAKNVTITVEAADDADIEDLAGLVLDLLHLERFGIDARGRFLAENVLAGAEITNESAPCIYVKNTDKVFVTTTKDTTNNLTVSGSFTPDGETNTDAVIFSKDDIVLNGEGTLNINSSDNGVTGKDDLKVTGSTINITCKSDGLEANDSVAIGGGTITIKTDKDGVHVEDSDDDTTGWFYMNGGTLNITAGDDGIHADTTVKIEDGTIIINNSYEGVEGNDVIINGGTVYVVASDDGVNAAGGQDQSSMGGRPGQNQFQPGGSSSSNSSITINGGYVYVISSGDGIDSNGSLSFNGGTVIVQGPATGGNFSVDADGTVGFNGGTVIAVCSSQAMWEDISGKLGSAVMNKSVGSVSKNGVIAVTDSSGNVICAVKSQLSGTVGVLCYSSSATPSTAVVGGT